MARRIMMRTEGFKGRSRKGVFGGRSLNVIEQPGLKNHYKSES